MSHLVRLMSNVTRQVPNPRVKTVVVISMSMRWPYVSQNNIFHK